MQPAHTPCPHTERLTTWHIRVTPLSGCTRSYVMTFVVVTILSAMDFWTVKNVSGRLLVGLRWWNDVDEAGQNHWRFESFEARGRPRPPFTEAVAAPPRHAMRVCVSLSRAQEQRFIHPSDSNFFWAVLFAAPIAWGILAFTALITFKVMWGLLTGAPAVALSGSSRRRSTPCRSPDHPDHGEPPSAGVAFMCNAINVVGYVKCKKDARKKLSALGGSVMLKGMEMWGSRKGASSSGA